MIRFARSILLRKVSNGTHRQVRYNRDWKSRFINDIVWPPIIKVVFGENRALRPIHESRYSHLSLSVSSLPATSTISTAAVKSSSSNKGSKHPTPVVLHGPYCTVYFLKSIIVD
jgi:hypothetical protein